MWNRVELKARGKAAFMRNYVACVVVTLLAALFAGESVSSGINFRYTLNGDNSISYGDYYDYYEDDGFAGDVEEFTGQALNSGLWRALVGWLSIWAAILGVVFLLLKIFVGNVLVVGGSRFYILNQTGKPGIVTVLDGFKSGHYGNLVLTMFLRDLYIALWSLLFVIPGIIKAYEYMMVPYILAENPGMDRREAFKISRQMMNGQKWAAFVMELSFIGWYLLGGICGLVSILFTNPYREATFAELYSYNKMMAFQQGYIR